MIDVDLVVLELDVGRVERLPAVLLVADDGGQVLVVDVHDAREGGVLGQVLGDAGPADACMV